MNGLLITVFSSSGSRGSIMGASSSRLDLSGDEERRFSHSVNPDLLGPLSRKVLFSSLILVWCFNSSSGDLSTSFRHKQNQMTANNNHRKKPLSLNQCFLYPKNLGEQNKPKMACIKPYQTYDPNRSRSKI